MNEPVPQGGVLSPESLLYSWSPRLPNSKLGHVARHIPLSSRGKWERELKKRGVCHGCQRTPVLSRFSHQTLTFAGGLSADLQDVLFPRTTGSCQSWGGHQSTLLTLCSTDSWVCVCVFLVGKLYLELEDAQQHAGPLLSNTSSIYPETLWS